MSDTKKDSAMRSSEARAAAPTSLLAELRRDRLSIAILCFAAAIIAGLWFAVESQISRERATKISDVMRENANLVRAFEEHTIRTLGYVDEIVISIKKQIESEGMRFNLKTFYRDLEPNKALLRNLVVTDETGRIIMGTDAVTPSISLADREHFKVHSGADTNIFFISKPLLARVNKQWSILATRRLNKRDGSFAGIVSAAIDPSYFSNFYRDVDLGRQGIVALVGLDGIVRARLAQDRAELGQDIAQAASFQRLAGPSAVPSANYISRSAVDDVERIYSSRRVRDYPLLVFVGTSATEALADVTARTSAYRIAMASMAAIIGAFAILIVVFNLRRTQSQRQIRELKEHEAAIIEASMKEARKTAQRLEIALAGSQISVWETDLRTNEIWLDAAWATYLGKPKAETFTNSVELRALVHPDDHMHVAAVAVQAMKGEIPDYEVEHRVQSASGEWKWIQSKGRVIERAPDGRPLRMSGTNADITERKRLAAESEHERDILENLACGEPLPALLTRLARGYEAMFPGMLCSILLLHTDGKRLTHGAAPSLPEAYCRAIDGLEIGPDVGSCGTVAYGKKIIMVANIATDPRWRDYRDLALAHGLHACWSVPILSSQGLVLGTFALYYNAPRAASAEDIATIERGAHVASLAIDRAQAESRRDSLEAQLRESQKMEAIGTLAGGIAHDFNNIITTILGNTELARQDSRNNSSTLRSLDEIRKAGTRALSLVRQILSFSRRQPAERKSTALATVINDTALLLRATLPARLQLTVTCEAGVPSVLADAIQIEQILLNLTTNAMQAFRDHPGHIGIRLDTILLDAALAHAHPALRTMQDHHPGLTVRLTVSDDGPGMDPALMGRIFEPFFTSKPVGEGTGLGLSVVLGIVQAHDGAITVDSQPGMGAKFTIYLPVADEHPGLPPAEIDPLPPAAAPRTGGVERILYLDDDEALVLLVQRLLEGSGYRVAAYTLQNEAIAAVRAAPDSFDIVITDYNMPGMSGLDVARAVREIRADLPVIVVSGFIDETLRAKVADAGVRELIFKATAVEDFCAVVQRSLFTPAA
jgi:PAS domain S-box-containing protein